MGEGQGMGETASTTSGYMTVGEIAQRAGVTVRSVQYYDQQGILSPSAKGPHNQRLYTLEDLDRLYCVLCLKYAGLSLGQIRQFVAGEAGSADDRGEAEKSASAVTGKAAAAADQAAAVEGQAAAAGMSGDASARPPMAIDRKIDAGGNLLAIDRQVDAGGNLPASGSPSVLTRIDDVFAQAIRKTEQDFAELLHRHAVLSGMRQAVLDTGRAGIQPDWQSMARGIEADAPHDADEGRRCVIAAWHEVIAEAVALMRRREPFDSAHSLELARKVVALRKADEGRPAEERFSLLEDMSTSFAFAHGEGFGDMRREMSAYLDQLVEACGGDDSAK